MSPRVTLGVATYERDTYLAEAIASCLRQTYDDLEVLVVLDGASNPNIERVLAGFDDRRLRLVRHERNRGIAEAYNTIIRETEEIDPVTQDMVIAILRDEEGHRRLFEGYLREYEAEGLA